ncbi:MAG: hypothetical protein JST39_05300, partial [Bacteroidetes bacterium]|nr:hypothetical protein [Bacteroidota bacterium]
MQQWEAMPPSGCWDAISSRLAAPAVERLYALEVPPPAASWDAIAAALHATISAETSRTEETPVRKAPVRPLYRAMAAAAVLIIAAGVWWMAGNRSNNTSLPPAPAGIAATPSGTHPGAPVVAGTASAVDESNNAGSSEGLNGYRNPSRRTLAMNARTLKYTSVNIQ